MNGSCRAVVPLVLIAALWPAASAFSGLHAEGQESRVTARRPATSLARPTPPAKPTAAGGFIRRWLILEPIRVAGQLTESAVRTAVEKDFPVPATPLPRDGTALTIGDNKACAKLKDMSRQFDEDAERLEKTDPSAPGSAPGGLQA